MVLRTCTEIANADYLIRGVVASVHEGLTDVSEADCFCDLFRRTDIVSGEI